MGFMDQVVPGQSIAIGSLVGDEEWTAHAGSFDVVDPGRLSDIVGTVATASASDIDRVVGVAARAQKAWQAQKVEERAALLLRAASELEEDNEQLAILLTRENGSVLPISRREILAAARMLRIAAEAGIELLGDGELFTEPESWVRIRRRPFGVVGCIVPWNAPVILTAQKIGHALVAGNTVIVKPSPFAPLAVSLILRRLASFFPPGVINVVHGDGDVGSALVAHRDVRKISFTGGGATAKLIMRSAADSLTKIHFELGGNDPAMVLDDADLEFTADRIAAQAFRRSGQVCFAIKRVYVPRAMAGALGEAILERVGRIAVGHGLDPESTMGPINNLQQFQKLRGISDRLTAAGANITTTGRALHPEEWENGHYLRPAVVLDADPSDPIVTEEQFGPILPIVGYDTEDEAVAMANGTEYGLGSSVWSSDPDRAVAFASRIQAGMTFINEHGLSALGQKHVPFGGIKQSGMGWENSSSGLAEYLEFHSITFHNVDSRNVDSPKVDSHSVDSHSVDGGK
jgi:acyl-CoA reductase-like NAD-dependent aldehyde dehydrogenase